MNACSGASATTGHADNVAFLNLNSKYSGMFAGRCSLTGPSTEAANVASGNTVLLAHLAINCGKTAFSLSTETYNALAPLVGAMGAGKNMSPSLVRETRR